MHWRRAAFNMRLSQDNTCKLNMCVLSVCTAQCNSIQFKEVSKISLPFPYTCVCKTRESNQGVQNFLTFKASCIFVLLSIFN